MIGQRKWKKTLKYEKALAILTKNASKKREVNLFFGIREKQKQNFNISVL